MLQVGWFTPFFASAGAEIPPELIKDHLSCLFLLRVIAPASRFSFVRNIIPFQAASPLGQKRSSVSSGDIFVGNRIQYPMYSPNCWKQTPVSIFLGLTDVFLGGNGLPFPARWNSSWSEMGAVSMS